MQEIARLQSTMSEVKASLATLIAQGVKTVANQNALDQQIASLQDAVAKETTVEQSAITLLGGIPGLIEKAVADAQASGVTAAELSAFTDLQAKIAGNTANLAAAVSANTPAAA